MTPEEKQEIINAVISQLLSSGRDITGLNAAQSLDGISTFPAVLTTTNNGVTTKALVSVPISLLTQSIQDVITSANTAATSARSAAAGWAAAAVKMGSDIVVIEGDISNLQDADKSLSSLTAYVECSTAANVSAKAVSVPFFTLPTSGGCLHIKMEHANTAVSGVTLNINSTEAIPLYYNGSAVSATNTWEDGEIIEVFYDGENYQATNAQGGGGSADRISFDNSESGLSAENVQEAIEEVKSLIGNASIKDIYPDMYPNILYVVDGNGYIGLKLDVNGLDIARISTHLASLIQDIAGSGGDSGGGDSGGGSATPTDTSTWLTDKRFVAIGASTSHLQTGVASWQEEFANRTGAVFYESIQNDLAEPGARCLSFVGNDRSDQFRLKLLKEKIDNGQADNVDVIIFMNGNDNNFSNYGAISDTPFFQQQIIYSSTIYESLDAANNAFGKSAQVPGIAGGVFPNVDENNRIGTIGRLRYASSNSYVWKKLTINNNASSSGSFTLQVGDSNYLIPVTLGDTPSTIIEEILSNDSGDYVFEKVEGENAIKISISEASAVVSVIGASNLGINAVLTDYSSGGVSYKQVCFLSRNKNDWGDYTKWGTPSLCACFMGMLEYAMTNFPNTQLFVFSTPRFIDVMEGNKSSYLRADGTFDIYSWNANNKKTKDLASSVNVKRNACSLFNVPFLEVKTESNISVYNASSFYSSGGVHPLSVGYRRWGATLARLLTGK